MKNKKRNVWCWRRVSRDLAVAFVISLSCAAPPGVAAAGPIERESVFPAIDEVRLGVFAADLEESINSEGDYAINAEMLFGRPDRAYDHYVWDYLLRPRPHIGLAINPDDGVNQAYFGVTWDIMLTDRLFLETSFGGAVHDGPTSPFHPDGYGCTLNFRESASLGLAFTERLHLLITVDHMSNAGLCEGNQGLTNAGVRLGYRW